MRPTACGIRYVRPTKEYPSLFTFTTSTSIAYPEAEELTSAHTQYPLLLLGIEDKVEQANSVALGIQVVAAQ